MTVLFHGSHFKHDELKPGFEHTGVLVQWDEVESNRFLYATSSRETAIELGFASSVEKQFDLDHFSSEGKEISIKTSKQLTLVDLSATPVYLYSIQYREEDGWVKNNNEHNGIDTEYKTTHTIKSIIKCEKVDVHAWLKDYKVVVNKA